MIIDYYLKINISKNFTLVVVDLVMESLITQQHDSSIVLPIDIVDKILLIKNQMEVHEYLQKNVLKEMRANLLFHNSLVHSLRYDYDDNYKRYTTSAPLIEILTLKMSPFIRVRPTDIEYQNFNIENYPEHGYLRSFIYSSNSDNLTFYRRYQQYIHL